MDAGGGCWDHAEPRHMIAHAAVLSHYGGTSGAHSPIAWRRCKPRDARAAGTGQDHTERWSERIAEALRRGIPGACTFASSGTRAQSLNHLQSTPRAAGGALKLHRQIVDRGREQTRQAGARQRPWEAKNPGRLGRTRSGHCRQQRRLPEVTPPVRRVLLWRERDNSEARKALGSHRLGGQCYAWGWAIASAGQGPRPVSGTARSRGGSETGRCAAARGRPATSLSATQRTVSGCVRWGSAVCRRGLGAR
jgi:hypothetical protein